MKVVASLSLLGILLASCGDKDSNDGNNVSPAVETKTTGSKDNNSDSNVDSKITDQNPSNNNSHASSDDENDNNGRRPNKKPRRPKPDGSLEIPPIPDAQVGRGYETTTGNEMQHCLGGSITKDTAGSFSSASFESITTFEDMNKLILKASSSSSSTFFTSLDKSHLFFKEEADSELTSTFKFANAYVLGTKHIDNTQFRVDTANLDKFRKTCGNKFISSALVGGVYAASVKLHFANEEVKKVIFNSKVKLENFADTLVKESLKLSAEQMAEVEVEISTMQVGGGGVSNPELPANAVLKCSMADLDSCVKVLKTISKYANEDFHKAIETSPATLSFQLNPYPL